MFRKIFLACAASSVALVALMGFSASALAVQDPLCDQFGMPAPAQIHALQSFGGPVGNVNEIYMDSPDSHRAFAQSGIIGGALACGSWFTTLGPTTSRYLQADIVVADGVVVTPTAGIPNGTYAGSAQVGVLSSIFGIPSFQPSAVTLTVASGSGCNQLVPVGSTLVACYFGNSALGSNYNITHVNASGNQTLTVGGMTPILGIAGLTRLVMNLCDNFGSVGGSTCGLSSDPPVQLNGAPSRKNCSDGKGIYTATATMENGTVTPPATGCIEWTLEGLTGSGPGSCGPHTISKGPIGGVLTPQQGIVCRK